MNRRRALDSLEDDIRDHIERETRENIERGMTPAAARAAALRRFGNVARTMEQTRGVWQRAWIEQLLQDLRYALRFLRRNPRFATVVVLMLALGIGMNTAVFSVVNTVLLKPIDYPNPNHLVWLADYDPNIHRDFVWSPDFDNWRKLAQSYSGMAGYGYQQAAIATPAGTVQASGIYIGGDFWSLTGARAALGRLCAESDPECLVLSWDFFQRQLGGDASLVGKTVTLNRRQMRLYAVLPAAFRFQFPMWWTELHPEPVEGYWSFPPPGQGVAQGMQVVAALKPGVSSRQAETELVSLERHLVETGHRSRGVMTALHVRPLQEKLTGDSRQGLLMLFAAGLLVLLIASVNIANLLLARATARSREVAIRAAVGAGRTRVMRQVLAESVLQALVGGAAGLLLARWAIAILLRISPYALPRLAETTIDGRVLAFTLATSIATGIFFGAGPAMVLWRVNLHDALKSGTCSSVGLSGARARRLLVAAELSLAIVVLTGAGLMYKSFERMNAHPPGFSPRNIAVMTLRFIGNRYLDDSVRLAYVDEALRRMESTPGVRTAGVSCWYLWSAAPAFPSDTDPNRTHVIRLNNVSPGYLKAMGMTLLRGRWLTDDDAGVALLNESMARAAFGAVDPVGRRISVPRPATIVGVVVDTKYSKLDAQAIPEVFLPYRHSREPYGIYIAARTIGPAEPLTATLQKQIAAIDPSQPVYDAKTLEEALAESIAPRRFNLFLLGAFALSALLLALVGIYGVIACSVAERTREIGLRMALGARSMHVAVMVVREAAAVAGAGIAAGLLAAYGLSRLMNALLYGVESTDPAVFTAVALLLGTAVLTASLAPALRALRIDPAEVLRE